MKNNYLSGARSWPFSAALGFCAIVAVGLMAHATPIQSFLPFLGFNSGNSFMMPTLQSFTSSTSDGTYETGATIDICANYGQVLETGSAMDITLDAGPTITLAHLDASIGGTISVDPAYDPTADNVPLAMALQPDGKLLVGGDFGQAGGVNRTRLARLNTDGTTDTSFGVLNNGADNRVTDIEVLPDGKIIVVGFFTAINGVLRNRIARLNTDGTVDNSFNPNANADIYAVAVQDDGKLVVGGDFT